MSNPSESLLINMFRRPMIQFDMQGTRLKASVNRELWPPIHTSQKFATLLQICSNSIGFERHRLGRRHSLSICPVIHKNHSLVALARCQNAHRPQLKVGGASGCGAAGSVNCMQIGRESVCIKTGYRANFFAARLFVRSNVSNSKQSESILTLPISKA